MPWKYTFYIGNEQFTLEKCNLHWKYAVYTGNMQFILVMLFKLYCKYKFCWKTVIYIGNKIFMLEKMNLYTIIEPISDIAPNSNVLHFYK